MFDLIRKASFGRMGAYAQFLSLLLVVGLTMLVVMSISGCDDCEGQPDILRKAAQGATRQCTISGPEGYPSSGERTRRTLHNYVLGDPPWPATVTYQWTPPPGASNFEWDEIYQPENPDGPPPYIFRDVPGLDDIDIQFDLPAVPPEKWTLHAVDTVLCTNSDGTTSAASLTQLVYGQPPLDAPPMERASAPDSPLVAAAPAQVNAWAAAQNVKVEGITLTQELCQDWLDLLLSDDAFLAARGPVASHAVTESYPLPVMTWGDNAPWLELRDNWTPVLSVPLEYRPERFMFLENNLPAAPGEQWLALGASSDGPTTCPDGLEIAADQVRLRGEALLDMSPLPNDCWNCELQLYYCYEGMDPPPLAAALPAIVSRVLDLQTLAYQGEGITCAGPALLLLNDQLGYEPLRLQESASAYVSPTMQVMFHHIARTRENHSVAFEYTSTLSTTWGFYEGDWEAPTLPLVEITQPVSFNGRFDFWAITDVPEDTPDGPYSLIITASLVVSPEVEVWTSDLLWSGGWAPPPGGPEYRVYLPLLLRNFP